jgi:hypothetical protein
MANEAESEAENEAESEAESEAVRLAYVARQLDRPRRNDPSDTSFRIVNLRCFDGDELAEVLRRNEHINHIELDLTNLPPNSNWDSLLRVLATRENLEKVELYADPNFGENHTEGATPFLLAIQHNPRVQTAEFTHIRLSGDLMASFLDNATVSITQLAFRWCEMVAPGGVLAVGAALQRNRNIQRLKLVSLDEMYVIPIVRSLTSNTTVKTLYLDVESVSLDASLAVGSLLEATTTLERFELSLDDDGLAVNIEVDTFRPIAQGLIQSKSVTDVRFKRCTFDGKNEVLMLNSILESKSNLRSLTLERCNVHKNGRQKFPSPIFNLLQPNSLLRSLELNDYDGDLYDYREYKFGTFQVFRKLLTAVESSPLRRFAIGTINSRESRLKLIASIPKMQVRTLELRLDFDLWDLKEGFMGAVKRNASLVTVVVKNNDGDDWFDDNDKTKLLSYSARNEFLDQWKENPTVVSKAAWPEYMAVAQTTGPDAVFRILLALAPSLGPFEGVQGCKRRRPNFYLPS